MWRRLGSTGLNDPRSLVSAFHPLRTIQTPLGSADALNSQIVLRSMPLDAKTKRQLEEARGAIIAQMDELEYRAGMAGGWRQRGPQDRGDVYDALKNELDEINQLLEPGDVGVGGNQELSSKSVSADEALNWSRSEPSAIGRIWAALQIALLVAVLGFAVASTLR